MQEAKDTTGKWFRSAPAHAPKPAATKINISSRKKDDLIPGAMYRATSLRDLEIVEAPKPPAPTPPLELQAGKEYRTFDGNKAKVFTINKEFPQMPVLGAVYTERGWEARVWNLQGVCRRPYGSNNDLVTDWVEAK